MTPSPHTGVTADSAENRSLETLGMESHSSLYREHVPATARHSRPQRRVSL